MKNHLKIKFQKKFKKFQKQKFFFILTTSATGVNIKLQATVATLVSNHFVTVDNSNGKL